MTDVERYIVKQYGVVLAGTIRGCMKETKCCMTSQEFLDFSVSWETACLAGLGKERYEESRKARYATYIDQIMEELEDEG